MLPDDLAHLSDLIGLRFVSVALQVDPILDSGLVEVMVTARHSLVKSHPQQEVSEAEEGDAPI